VEMLDKIKKCVETHNRWRREECLNMIASENVMSPMATKFFCTDFEGRYNEHTGPDCHYCGTAYSYEIEEICNELFRKNFDTPFADVRPISGGVANLVVFNALTSPGDTTVSLGIPNGAHVSSTKWGMAGVHGLKTVDMVFDVKEMNIDVEKTVEVIEKSRPKLIMFGASMFLFPEPVKEIKELIDPSIKVVYDAAHVFGLVYNKEFQAPLEEGADLITASTHKTFPGPQGAVIIGNKNLSEVDWEKIQKSIFPGIMSNTHIHRFPSLAITALEMNEFGKEYAKQVIANSKALGKHLLENDFRVLCPDKDFTESHQIIVDVKEFGGGRTVAKKLEECNIITNKIAMPTDTPQDATNNPSAIRLGSQELTRWGMKEREMQVIAEFFKRVLIKKEDTEKIKKEVIEMKKEFNKVHYCFELD
jgi:glycine hydroxymethyltransferase